MGAGLGRENIMKGLVVKEVACPGTGMIFILRAS